jgi:hypothetical protein
MITYHLCDGVRVLYPALDTLYSVARVYDLLWLDRTSAIRKSRKEWKGKLRCPFRFLFLGAEEDRRWPESRVALNLTVLAFCGVLKSNQKCHQIAPLIRSLEFKRNGNGSLEQRDPLPSTALQLALCQYIRYLSPERPVIPSKGQGLCTGLHVFPAVHSGRRNR